MEEGSFNYRVLFLFSVVLIASGCAHLSSYDHEDEEPEQPEVPEAEEAEEVAYNTEVVAESLESPWGIDFVPGTDLVIVTQNSGSVVLVNRTDGSLESLNNVPEVDDRGQGGMLDVEVHPEFPDEEWVYLTYTDGNGEGTATHLGRAELDLEQESLENFEVLHVAEPYLDEIVHYGSRVVLEGGYVYFTTGDRGDKNFGPEHVSQNTTNELGATLRLTEAGEVPEDNPFVDDPDVEDSIYTYGHRNSQGMTFHPDTGEIWQSEHGEEDGDEINVIREGENYGWPITHYGCKYGTDEPVAGNPDQNPDVADPVYYWECNTGGFPPAGMTFYEGEGEWSGDLFVGNLAGRYLGHFDVEEGVGEKDPLLEEHNWRIRDVEMSPDTENLYVIVDDEDAPLVRIVPEN